MGWAKYLKHHGYQPIIVTRDWQVPIKNPKDLLISSGKDVIHEIHESHEVYYLPYKSNLRDRIFVKYEGSKRQWISKFFTAYNLIAENFFVKSIPHHNLYNFARDFLDKHKDVHQIIISGNPFESFYYGYLLKKEFNIDWIADYRDDWNTNELKSKPNFLIKALQQKSERKWVKSATCFTTVSEKYKQKIEAFTKIKGHVILNGYDFDVLPTIVEDKDHFTITYNGSLYQSQDIETFFRVAVRLIHEGYDELVLQFPGLAFDPEQLKRVRLLAESIKENILISPRVSRDEVIQIQQKSDLLLMLSYGKHKGIPSSKLYEYIGLHKPILTFPNDKDIIEETLSSTGLGLICESELELYTTLKSLLDKKRNSTPLLENFDENAIQLFSRKNQTKKLAELLNSL